ncbi:MAG: pantoate--beta-alanine ligase [Sphingopyxis sp.]
MQTIHRLSELSSAIAQLRGRGARIAFVPTMGALHQGHMALINAAKTVADHVIASIFVNPMQFGPNEDLDSYPRPKTADIRYLTDAGVALLWAPNVPTMYPDGYATKVTVAGLDTMLCGAARPGHFDGVGTVVAKLFNQVHPDIALFGEKDWQQLAIIRRMEADLNFGIKIVGVPTVREADGLALSSRNAFLSKEQRSAATGLPSAMNAACLAMQNGVTPAAAIERAKGAILSAGFASIDYLELRDGASLALLDHAAQGARLFAAARIGTTRLIDNIAFG